MSFEYSSSPPAPALGPPRYYSSPPYQYTMASAHSPAAAAVAVAAPLSLTHAHSHSHSHALAAMPLSIQNSTTNHSYHSPHQPPPNNFYPPPQLTHPFHTQNAANYNFPFQTHSFNIPHSATQSHSATLSHSHPIPLSHSHSHSQPQPHLHSYSSPLPIQIPYPPPYPFYHHSQPQMQMQMQPYSNSYSHSHSHSHSPFPSHFPSFPSQLASVPSSHVFPHDSHFQFSSASANTAGGELRNFDAAEFGEQATSHSQLQQQQQRQQQQQTTAIRLNKHCSQVPSASAGSFSSLSSASASDLVCPLCHRLLVSPHSISCCRHLFCRDCIFDYFSSESNNCPLDRQRAGLPQHRDDFEAELERVKNSLSPAAAAAYSIRQREFHQKLQFEESELNKVASEFSSQNKIRGRRSRIRIDAKWEIPMKNRIRAILSVWSRPSRQFAFSQLGLDENYLNEASNEKLRIAASNLRIDEPKGEIEMIREKLWKFVVFGEPRKLQKHQNANETRGRILN